MAQTFHIKAGATALAHIREHGLSPADISVMPAAAGGPKWISLYGLDKYLMEEWFSEPDQLLHLIGASAGAWRMLCYCLPDPLAALDRYLKYYVEQSYPVWPGPAEVSGELRHIIEQIVGECHYSDIESAINKKLYVINSRSRFHHRGGNLLKLKLLQSGLANLISRKSLFKYFDRVVYHSQSNLSSVINDDTYGIECQEMNQDVFLSSLQATGSIPALCYPVVMQDGLNYWDGGITDYHVAFEYDVSGLILYPHFSASIKPGWFDKHLPKRVASRHVTDRMIMIYPSQRFIDALPDQKIPDRKDFEAYFQKDDQRIKNWYQVAQSSEELAAEFKVLYESGNLMSHIESF